MVISLREKVKRLLTSAVSDKDRLVDVLFTSNIDVLRGQGVLGGSGCYPA
jgi:hypothetical protein